MNDGVKPFYTEERIKDMIKTIRKAIIQTKKIHDDTIMHDCTLCNTQSNANNSVEDLERIEINMIQNTSMSTDERLGCGYIFNIHVKKDEKVIVFGDFHGSFHTFYRNFLRLDLLGIIDFRNYIINDGYKIIFLGDIADRGQYALEIYYIICKFICNNNRDPKNLKIILNRGNHEEPTQWRQENASNKMFGFTAELSRKLTQDNIDIILDYIKKLLSYSSSGIILTCHSEIINENLDFNLHRYWLSHGGIPVYNSHPLKLDYNDRCTLINRNYAYSVRWGDYNPEIDITMEVDYRLKICNTDLYSFLDNNNIDFIIRGHNDDFENAYLVSDSKDSAYTEMSYTYVYPLNQLNLQILNKRLNPDLSKISFPPVEDIFSNPLINTIMQYDGPIARIIPKEWYKKKEGNKANQFNIKMIDAEGNPSRYPLHSSPALNNTFFNTHNKPVTVYPILTTSTNSCAGKSLNKDCLIVLNYEKNDKLNINNSKVELLNNLKA